MRRFKILSIGLLLTMMALQSCCLFSFYSKNADCPSEKVGSGIKPSLEKDPRAKRWGESRSAELRDARRDEKLKGGESK